MHKKYKDKYNRSEIFTKNYQQFKIQVNKKISFDKIPNVNAIKNSLDKIHSKSSKKTLSKSNDDLGKFKILKNEAKFKK